MDERFIEAAEAHQQNLLDVSIRQARLNAGKGPTPKGYCLACGLVFPDLTGCAVLDEGQPDRWCDADCRDDWERDQARLRNPAKAP